MSDHTARLRAEPYRRWYWTARWKRLRAAHLRAEPCCRMCAERKRVTAGTIVDHIQPHKGNEALMWDPTNLQTLCDDCHQSDKRRIENSGIPRVQIGVDGWPE